MIPEAPLEWLLLAGHRDLRSCLLIPQAGRDRGGSVFHRDHQALFNPGNLRIAAGQLNILAKLGPVLPIRYLLDNDPLSRRGGGK